MEVERALRALADGGDRYGFYRDLAARPAYRSFLGFTLLVDPVDVRAALRSKDFSASVPMVDPRQAANPDAHTLRLRRLALPFLDGADHDRVRGVMAAAFAPERVALHAATARATAEELVQEMIAAPDIDAVASFASPIASAVLAAALGIEPGAAALSTLGSRIARLIDLLPGRAAIVEAESALGEIRELYRTARSQGGESMVDRFRSAVELGELTEDEAITNLGFLIGAGQETSRSAIASTVWRLAVDRGTAQRLRADPSSCDRFVEDTLRLESPVQFTMRTATVETDLPRAGRIRRGERLLVGLGAMNREIETGHVAFGGGAHYCLGAAMARMSVRASLAVLLERSDLAPAGEVEWMPSVIFRGPSRLPVRATARGALAGHDAAAHHGETAAP